MLACQNPEEMPPISWSAVIFLFSYQSNRKADLLRLLDVTSSAPLTFPMAAAAIRLQGSAPGW